MNRNRSNHTALRVCAWTAVAVVLAAVLPFGPVRAFADDGARPGGGKSTAAPSVSSLYPNAGAPIGGTFVTIYGSNFSPTGTTRVTFGGVEATDVYVGSSGYESTNNYVACITPPHAEGTVDVVVINPDGQSATLAGGFTYRTPPAPAVSHLSPSSGLSSGGTVVDIYGTNFMPEGLTRVTFGGAEAVSVRVISESLLLCVTPPHALGAVDVTVIRADGQSATKPNGFTYAPPPAPVVTGTLPASGPVEGGIEVRVQGSNFSATGTTQVTFGGVAATNVAYRSGGGRTAPYLNCTLPPHALGAVDVVVINPDGQSGTKPNGFTYAPPPPPTPTSVSPPRGTPLGGTAVYILGSGLVSTGSYRVTFGGVDATNVQLVNDGISSIRITCTTPAHAEGAVDVTLIRSDGQSGTLPGGYTYTSTTGPVLTYISPSNGTTLGDAPVQLSGWGFSEAGVTRVTFGGVDATNVAVFSQGYGDNPFVTCTAPPHAAGVVDVVIINPDGQSYTRSGGFEYIQAPPPAPVSMAPSQGTTLGGTEVSISGSNFSWGGTLRVTFDGVEATNVRMGAGGYMVPPTLVCTTPAHAAGAVDVVVINSDGQTGTLSNGFTYTQAPAPTLDSVTPARGPATGGARVLLTGTGFAQIGTTRVSFGGVDATEVSVAGDTIRCVTPVHAVGAVDVTVVNPDGQTGTLPGAFSYRAPGELVLRVDGDNVSGVEDGMTWETAFATIQGAITAAAASEQSCEVWVAEGTYTAAAPGTVVVSMEYLCDLYGGFAGVETQRDARDIAAHTTVIDGQNESACVYGADAARLDGFTVTGGRGPLRLGEQSSWLGLLAIFPSEGGLEAYVAMDNSGTSPTLANCRFTGNSPGMVIVANLTEGGSPSSPVILGCEFAGNTGDGITVLNGAQSGVSSEPRIEGCSFTGGTTGIVDVGWSGECSPTIAGCVFTSNATALQEMALSPGACATHVENTVFVHNTADTLYFMGLGGEARLTPVFTNCTFTENTGAREMFFAPYGSVQVDLRNSIVWGNTGPLLGADGVVTLTASHCDLQGGFAGTGNLDADPLFVDTASGDFRLEAGSPCIDAGTADDAPETDLVGMPRPQGAGVDMGAMEMLVSTMPDLSGLARTAAVEWLSSAHLYVRDETEEYHPTIPDDHVIGHTPPADTVVLSGSPVDWVISKGPEPVAVPEVAGQTLDAASSTIANAGLAVGTVTEQFNSAVPAGVVFGQSPAAGSQAAPGTGVDLLVSKGPQPVAVPDVAGLTQDAAATAIVNAGLAVGAVTQEHSATAPAGTVLSQSPAAGSLVPPGSPVDFVVSRGVQPSVMPEVVGQARAQAEAAITGAGLVPGMVTEGHSDTVPAGSVLAQSPAAGTELPPGTTVSIVVSLGPAPTVEGEGEGEVSNVETAQQKLADAYDTADMNGDGALSFGEASAAVAGLTQGVFDELDSNADGQLSAAELGVDENTGCAGCQGGKSAVTTGSRLGDLFLTGLGLLGLAAMAVVRRP